MAILQVITASKENGEYADLVEAQDAYTTDTNTSALRTYLLSAQSSGDFSTVTEWDSESQTLTYNRTWDETAYNAYIAAQETNRNTAKANAETAGWAVSESISTV